MFGKLSKKKVGRLTCWFSSWGESKISRILEMNKKLQEGYSGLIGTVSLNYVDLEENQSKLEALPQKDFEAIRGKYFQSLELAVVQGNFISHQAQESLQLFVDVSCRRIMGERPKKEKEPISQNFEEVDLGDNKVESFTNKYIRSSLWYDELISDKNTLKNLKIFFDKFPSNMSKHCTSNIKPIFELAVHLTHLRHKELKSGKIKRTGIPKSMLASLQEIAKSLILFDYSNNRFTNYTISDLLKNHHILTEAILKKDKVASNVSIIKLLQVIYSKSKNNKKQIMEISLIMQLSGHISDTILDDLMIYCYNRHSKLPLKFLIQVLMANNRRKKIVPSWILYRLKAKILSQLGSLEVGDLCSLFNILAKSKLSKFEEVITKIVKKFKNEEFVEKMGKHESILALHNLSRLQIDDDQATKNIILRVKFYINYLSLREYQMAFVSASNFKNEKIEFQKFLLENLDIGRLIDMIEQTSEDMIEEGLELDFSEKDIKIKSLKYLRKLFGTPKKEIKNFQVLKKVEKDTLENLELEEKEEEMVDSSQQNTPNQKLISESGLNPLTSTPNN